MPRAGAPVQYGNVRDEEIELSPEEMQSFVRKAAAMKKLLDDRPAHAKYKLEIMFGEERSNLKPTTGVLSFWGNGTKLHGGGDEKLYLCPGNRLLRNGCACILHDAFNDGTGIICPNCGSKWLHEQVTGELFFRLPMVKWADVLCRYFAHFEHNCDLYLKHAPTDIRSVSLVQAQHATWQGTKRLDATRQHRARYIYPLRN